MEIKERVDHQYSIKVYTCCYKEGAVTRPKCYYCIYRIYELSNAMIFHRICIQLYNLYKNTNITVFTEAATMQQGYQAHG